MGHLTARLNSQTTLATRGRALQPAMLGFCRHAGTMIPTANSSARSISRMRRGGSGGPRGLVLRSFLGTVVTSSHLTIVRRFRPPSPGSNNTCQTMGRSWVEHGRIRSPASSFRRSGEMITAGRRLCLTAEPVAQRLGKWTRPPLVLGLVRHSRPQCLFPGQPCLARGNPYGATAQQGCCG